MNPTPIHLFDPTIRNNHALLQEVLVGLSRTQKSIPPKFLYDQRGSEIFEQICRLKEYYPTRAEKEILATYGAEIAGRLGENAMLFEPGSGAAEKIRFLLPHLKRAAGYIPMEICKETLLNTSSELEEDFPGLMIRAVCADFTQNLQLEKVFHGHQGPRVTFFPGSTIGNFTPGEATSLLEKFRLAMDPGGSLLIGVDLKKDPAILKLAYDDPQGVTAEFNLNLLARLNRETSANFVPENFYHEALYNEKHGRVEMHLRSRISQLVRVNQTVFKFSEGESIHTENSYKYSTDEFIELAAGAGFRIRKFWKDQQGLLCLYHFESFRE
jgi:dimethylhistidine N-methyltransferase